MHYFCPRPHNFAPPARPSMTYVRLIFDTETVGEVEKSENFLHKRFQKSPQMCGKYRCENSKLFRDNHNLVFASYFVSVISKSKSSWS